MNFLLSLAFSIVVMPASQDTQQGLAIHVVNQPYPDFTQGNKECYYCIDLQKDKISAQPILTEVDIASFDWASQQVMLTEAGKEKVLNLDIPLPGLAVALVLHGEPVYGFWFWNSLSAYTCDRVCATPTKEFKITFGLPGVEPYGSDPRFDPELEFYVKKNLKK